MRRILAMLAVLALAGCDPVGTGTPTPPAPDLGALETQARDRVGADLAAVPDPALIMSGPVVADGSGSAGSLDAGHYEIGAACAGVGEIEVTWQVVGSGPTQYGSLPAPCGDAGVFAANLDVPLAGELRLSLRDKGSATGQAAYAILVTPPREEAAAALLDAVLPEQVPVDTGFGNTFATVSFLRPVGPGHYLLRIGCVGVGVLSVRIDGSGQGGTTELTCQPAGAVAAIEAVTDDQITITVGDAPWTTGFASYAYTLLRVTTG